MRADARIAVAVTMLAIFVMMCATATTFPPAARLVPLLVAVPAIVLCICVLWSEAARARLATGAPAHLAARERPRDIRERPAHFHDEVILITWVWAFAVAIIAAGFLVGGTLATLAFVRFRLHERLAVTIGAGALLYFTLHLVFERMLGLVLFQGLVIGG